MWVVTGVGSPKERWHPGCTEHVRQGLLGAKEGGLCTWRGRTMVLDKMDVKRPAPEEDLVSEQSPLSLPQHPLLWKAVERRQQVKG